MNLPGFTAEGSLYKTAQLYSMAVTSDHTFAHIRSQVRPALPPGLGETDAHQCYLDCIDAGHVKGYCFNHCYPAGSLTQGTATLGRLPATLERLP